MSKINNEKLSKWTAVLLAVLLIVYYVNTLVSTKRISDQVEMIGKHPYPISIEVGYVTTYATQLDSLAERLTYIRTPEMLENTRQDYDKIDKEIAGSLDFIVDRYISYPEDALSLRQDYYDLREAQDKFLTLCEDPAFDNEAAQNFYHTEIEPRIERMNSLADSMRLGSEAKFAVFADLAYESRVSTIVFSTVLLFAVLAALGIFLYILRKKHRQEERMQYTLREALESAQNANMAKSQFLFNMSHDIRTPMNAVIGMTAIATIHADDPVKVRDCLSKITASSKHLLSLINDVLDMSKIESGKLSLNEEDFILPEFIRDFLTIVEPQVKAKQLQFDISACGVEHERVTGDTLRINQALLNIVGNAVKFTPPGGRVEVRVCELPPRYKGYGTYQFTISDTGIGMPKEFMSKIFEPFERANTSTNSRIEGTGLGLAITKNIIDMMNGQISVSSEEGQGTSFQVTLHLKLQPEEEKQYDFSALRELRSLVVDDDQDVCECAARMLREIGMRSEWVLTGMEAVGKVTEAHSVNQDYHSVIIDWKMPDMDGLETTRRIRGEVGDDIPIIVITAYDWTEIEEEARQAGVNAFLPKPLFRSSLYQVMYDLVSGRKPMREEPRPKASAAIGFDGCVLLVEDNEINMEIVQEYLLYSGCSVEKAWDGLEALRMFESAAAGYYGLILMDIQMPNMDGYEATRQMRIVEQEEGRGHTPIVAMSANAFEDDIKRAYNSGMDGYITKPMELEDLRSVLRTYLVSRR